MKPHPIHPLSLFTFSQVPPGHRRPSSTTTSPSRHSAPERAPEEPLWRRIHRHTVVTPTAAASHSPSRRPAVVPASWMSHLRSAAAAHLHHAGIRRSILVVWVVVVVVRMLMMVMRRMMMVVWHSAVRRRRRQVFHVLARRQSRSHSSATSPSAAHSPSSPGAPWHPDVVRGLGS